MPPEMGLRVSTGARKSLEIPSVHDAIIYGRDDLPRDELGTLVDQLVESVLTVGTALTPDNRSSLVVDSGAVLGNALTVGLHVTLLEVVGKLLEILVVRQEGLSLGT